MSTQQTLKGARPILQPNLTQLQWLVTITHQLYRFVFLFTFYEIEKEDGQEWCKCLVLKRLIIIC